MVEGGTQLRDQSIQPHRDFGAAGFRRIFLPPLRQQCNALQRSFQARSVVGRLFIWCQSILRPVPVMLEFHPFRGLNVNKANRIKTKD
jgi:hypothetical protein